MCVRKIVNNGIRTLFAGKLKVSDGQSLLIALSGEPSRFAAYAPVVHIDFVNDDDGCLRVLLRTR